MSLVDWLIVCLYVLLAIGIGAFFAKRASSSTADFFVAGRSLPWWVAGTSMVATTFSSDTPLFVAGAVREQGVYANWLWWSGIIGVVISVFFFSGLWRRSRAVSAIELVCLRYDGGRATDALRIFKSMFDGVFINCIVMASVILAMSKIVGVILQLTPEPLLNLPLVGTVTSTGLVLLVLGLVVFIYSILSGLYGVVYTDLIQFGLAIIGAVSLAAIVYIDLSDKGGVVEAIQSVPGVKPDIWHLLPELGWNLDTLTFLILVTVGWWYLAPGAGYFVQRVLATRSEKDAALAVYWYAFCHYVLRSWPWILVGLASLVYFPDLGDSEQAYPNMISAFLPIGLKGVMIASLLAAFMSTLDTHMNWGSSYLVNDMYQPYMAPGRGNRHYVRAARFSMLALILLSTIIATSLSGILAIYKYLAVILPGAAFPLIARWYWWRINVWSEISALATAALVGNVLLFVVPDRPDEDWFGVRILINVIASTLVCLAVTLLTSRQGPTAKALEFYSRLRIPGPGWRRVRQLTGQEPLSANVGECLIACVASIAFLLALLFGVGYWLFEQWDAMLFCTVLALVSGYVVHQRVPNIIGRLVSD